LEKIGGTNGKRGETKKKKKRRVGKGSATLKDGPDRGCSKGFTGRTGLGDGKPCGGKRWESRQPKTLVLGGERRGLGKKGNSRQQTDDRFAQSARGSWVRQGGESAGSEAKGGPAQNYHAWKKLHFQKEGKFKKSRPNDQFRRKFVSPQD